MSKPTIQNPYFRIKPVERIMEEAKGKKDGLKRVLNAVDLTAIGIGAMIGAGIFVLTGSAAADEAGPGIMLSYVFAGFACIMAALCYTEFATRLPISGSAYTFAYSSVGELLAWIIGWDLVMEYTIGASAVAVGWSEYLVSLKWAKPLEIWTAYPMGGVEVNFIAVLLIAVLSILLMLGMKESARFNGAMVALKIGVVLFVILVGAFFITPENWTSDFVPYGWGGVFSGAALVFFSYIGFDAVSTAAEEVENPQKNLPIGIIGSLSICTLLYIAVAAVITGMVPYHQIDRGAPLAIAFSDVGVGWAKDIIGIGGVAGLTTVVLILLMSQPRIYYSMARDGLLFPFLAKVHEKYRTPYIATIITGILAAVFAVFVPLKDLHHMVSIGTLFAFTVVSASVLILRYKTDTEPVKSTIVVGILALGMGLTAASYYYGLAPWTKYLGWAAVLIPIGFMVKNPQSNIPTNTFKCPWVPWVPLTGMASMIYMMVTLSQEAWERLALWMAIGLIIYALYGISHSKIYKDELAAMEKSKK